MTEDIFTQVVRLAHEAGLGLPTVLAVVVVLAVMLVLGKKLGVALKGWTPPDPSVEPEKSPPIAVREDGSIPTANPVTPPDPGPM
jgi:hypothetical protein